MGQFAGGSSAQPFNTEKDYTNFSKEWTRIAYGLFGDGIHEKRIY
jgi:hypothetical protein